MALLSLVHGVTPLPLEKQGHLIQRTSIHKPWVEMIRSACLQDPDGVRSCSPGVDAQRPLLGGARDSRLHGWTPSGSRHRGGHGRCAATGLIGATESRWAS
jgi:hypothetical protein